MGTVPLTPLADNYGTIECFPYTSMYAIIPTGIAAITSMNECCLTNITEMHIMMIDSTTKAFHHFDAPLYLHHVVAIPIEYAT